MRNLRCTKHLIPCFYVLLLSLLLLSQTSAQTAKRALIISIDGLDVRYLADADKYGLKIPTLRRLMANGVTSRGVYSVHPSVTYPNHTSIVTGTVTAKHGILGNGVFEAPGTKTTGAWYWYARDIKTDTLWQAAKRSGKTVGLVSWPVSTGAGDWNVPEIWQPGGSREDSQKVIAANSIPFGLLGDIEAKFPDLYAKTTNDEGDDARTKIAEYILTEKRPDLLLLHIYDLDHFEHDHGPFTPEALAMLEKSDGYVARLLAALERAGTLNETAVFITSDHGFRAISKQVNPNVLLRQAGLITGTTEKDANGRERFVATDWKAAAYVNAAACAIYVKNANDLETIKKVREIFEPLAGKPGSGILKIVERDEIKRIGSNPNAILLLEPAEGFSFGGTYSGEAIVNSRSKGTHGYLPTTPDFLASFIASGVGISRRGWIDRMSMPDAGTTIAATLELKLKDATGKVAKLR